MIAEGKKAPGVSFLLGKAKPLVIARLITAVLTTAIPMVLARLLELHVYGTYKQLFLVVQTLTYVLPFGFPQSVYFFAPRSEHKRPFFMHSMMFTTLGGVLAATGLWFAMGELLPRFFSNPTLSEYRVPVALYALFLMSGKPLEMSLTSQGKTRAAAICYLVSDTLRAVIMVVPVLLGMKLLGVMYAVAGFAALRSLASWLVLIKGSTGPLYDRQLFLRQLTYALPFGLAVAILIPQQYAHQFVVSGTMAPEVFALYAVGCFQLPIVDLLYTPTSEVLMVRLGELERAGLMQEAAGTFRQAVLELSRFFVPLAAFLVVVAPEFIVALFGEKFLPSAQVFRVGVVSVLLATLPVDGVLRARNETRHILISNAVKAAVTVPLVYFGVRQFGLMGAIGSWAITELVGKTMLMLCLRRALSPTGELLSYRELLPWRALLVTTGATVLATLVLLSVRGFAANEWAHLAPSGLLWRLSQVAVLGLVFGTAYLLALRMAGVRVSSLLTQPRGQRAA
ncbi:lipopolysaccharide biosynthesis protein [Archangium lansingense]|uniref:Lipopolysaccharide biosynthesis protein n=1 Tax=Archangium lansingense TaxID=2995310 RepID=A0ABT4AJL2_9BACT|nr:lipopolysaccharide biosynthesis protein [Archangium lansinium]MCY1081867.1 lipopolysaccharide biosynthesis protein [Archangium lansinium]